MNKKFSFKNEDGSLSIEFMGLLPFVLILFLVLWQLIGTGSSLLMAQKAISESAKVYSITEDRGEAENAVREIIGDSSSLDYSQFNIVEEGDGYFRVKFIGNYKAVFLPLEWQEKYAFEVPHQSYSRVIE